MSLRGAPTKETETKYSNLNGESADRKKSSKYRRRAYHDDALKIVAILKATRSPEGAGVEGCGRIEVDELKDGHVENPNCI